MRLRSQNRPGYFDRFPIAKQIQDLLSYYVEALNRVQDVIVNDLSRMVKENSCLSYLPGMYVGTYVHTLSLPSFLTRHEVIFTLFSSPRKNVGNTNERHKKERKKK